MAKRDLASAYSAKRLAKGGKVKKGKLNSLAEGGEIQAERVEMARPRIGDSAIEGEDISMQAKRGGKFPLKHPKMVESILSTKLRQDEADLMDSAKPEMAEGGKVKKDYSGGQKRGPEGYPKYQEQAQNEKGVHTPVSGVTAFPGGKGTSAAGDYTKDRYAGKPTFEAGKDHPARKEHARVIEESRKIHPKLKGLAEGGEVGLDEQELEHAASLAAAIMAKRKMANGGILSDDSLDSDESDTADLDRNAEEDANMEDKASFDALRKENYSESDGLDALDSPEDSNEHGHEMDDEHDTSIASKIRAKMKKRSPITE